MNRPRIASLLVVATLATAGAACSKTDAGASPAAAATPGAGGGAGAGKSANGAAPGAPGAAGAGDGRRAAPTIILAANDVRTVQRGAIEEGMPINGDLRPIEQVSIKARLEGDLVGVYVREGDIVRRGQLLARFEASEQESDRTSATAERAAAESELATAQWNSEQSAELFKAGAIPERDLRTAQQAVAASRARLAAAESRVRSATSFVVDTRVLAPTNGTIEQRMVENGEHLARGAALFTLVRNDVLELAAAVPARQANDIRPNQRVRFNAGGRDFEGKVARVSPTINTSTRALTVFIQVPNPTGEIKGNTLATGRVIARTVPDALIIPSAAIRQSQDGGKPFVYRIVNGALEHAPIQLGIVDEAQGIAQVVEGLIESDRIVVGNVGTLGRGMKVQVLTAETRPSS